MRVLLVGLGRWGMNHLRTLQELGVDVLTCDTDMTKEPDITTHRELLGCVDAVDIVTPADSHYAICMDCLRAGKDVFVEKPIALTSSQACEMVSEAEKRDLILQVGHVFRYHSAIQDMKDGMRDVGNMRYVYGHFMSNKKPRTDVGVTHTDSIHFFDLFNYLFGVMPSSVVSVTKSFLGNPLDDTSVSVLDYGGRMAVVESSCIAPQEKRDIAIAGSMGSLHFDFLDQRYASGKPLTAELSDFLCAMETRAKPVSDGRCGYDALRVVEACYLSSIGGKRVYL